MRKLALLLAAALVISAPLIAAAPTLTYAAGKAKKAGKKVVKKEVRKAVTKEAAKAADPAEVNSRFGRALGDLFQQLGTYRYVYDPAAGGDKGGKGAKGGAKMAGKKAK